MTTAANETHWAPQEAAGRDLILLALSRTPLGTFSNDSGKVLSEVRVACKIANTDSNNTALSRSLTLMAHAKLVTVERQGGGNRTYSVTLNVALSDSDIAALVAREAENRTRFQSPPTTPQMQRLIEGCQRTLAAMQRSRDELRVYPEFCHSDGGTQLNATAIQKGVGIKEEDERRRLRHYLAKLGLIKAYRKGDLWYWIVNNGPLNEGALVALASGPDSYEHHKARKEMDKARESKPVTVTCVDTTSDAVAKAPRPLMPTPLGAKQQAEKAETTRDPLDELAAEFTLLMSRQEQLVAEVKALKATIAQRDAHIAKLEALARQPDGREKAAALLASIRIARSGVPIRASGTGSVLFSTCKNRPYPLYFTKKYASVAQLLERFLAKEEVPG